MAQTTMDILSCLHHVYNTIPRKDDPDRARIWEQMQQEMAAVESKSRYLQVRQAVETAYYYEDYDYRPDCFHCYNQELQHRLIAFYAPHPIPREFQQYFATLGKCSKATEH